jgi:hypothetical protein
LERKRISPCPTLYGHDGAAFGNSHLAVRDARRPVFVPMINTDDPKLAPKTVRAFDATVSVLAKVTCRS